MSKFLFHQYKYGSDNYGVLAHDPLSSKTACIDVGDADKALKELENQNWKLDEIWITHHHGDHTEGLLRLKQKTGAFVYGPQGNDNAYFKISVLEFEIAGQADPHHLLRSFGIC